MSEQKLIVPFGKYKGQPVEAMAGDQNYLEWLTAQEWFRSKFQNMYTLIINNFSAPAETPDHNQMQIRFLDIEYRIKLAYLVFGDEIFKFGQAFFDAVLADMISDIQEAEGYKKEEISRRLLKQLKEMNGADLLQVGAPAFENSGIDVVYWVLYGAVDNFGYPLRTGTLFEKSLKIELKPSISDDFPSVLRQMNACNASTLVLRAYKGEGANLQQFIEYFASQGITVVFEKDIVDVVVPDFDKTLSVNIKQIEELLTPDIIPFE